MEQCTVASQGTIAFVPPHGVEDCTVFLPLACALGCIRDLLLGLSRLLGLAPHLSFGATGKPLPRWRLTLAQEAARGTFFSSSLFFVSFR